MPNVHLDGQKGHRILCDLCWRERNAQPLGETPPGAPRPRGPAPYRPPSSIYSDDGEDECPPLEEDDCPMLEDVWMEEGS